MVIADMRREEEARALSHELASLLAENIGEDEPGASVALLGANGVIAASYRGMADLEHGIPIGPRTRFDIGSISKQMTAACALALARDGLVDLGSDIRDVIPEVPIDVPVSWWQCLHHTSGLWDYRSIENVLGLSLADVANEDAFLALISRMSGLDFPPGTDVKVSNTGFVLVAAASARVAGRPFQEVLQCMVLEPTKMADTLVRDSTSLHIPDLAISYDVESANRCGGFTPVPSCECHVGDRGVISTLTDLAAWHGFLVDGRGLGPDLLASLTRRARLDDGREVPFSAGLFHTSIDGEEALMHRGATYGFRSYLLAARRTGLGVAVLGNRSDLQAPQLAWRALALICDAAQEPRSAIGAESASDAAGRWISDELSEHADVHALPNQSLVAAAGAHRHVLDPAGHRRWRHSSGAPTVELHSDSLLWIDRIGRRVRYQKAAAEPEPPHAHLIGRYLCAELAAELQVMVLSSGILIFDGGLREPIALDFIARIRDDAVYAFSDGWIRFHDCTHATATSATLNIERTILRYMPRAEPTPPG